MYRIENIDGKPSEIRIFNGDSFFVAELRGGNTLNIAGQFAALQRVDEKRADDYMAGIVSALTHCSMVNEVPAIRY